LLATYGALCPSGWYFGVLGEVTDKRDRAGTMDWEFLLLVAVALWMLVVSLLPRRLRLH
jgi:hypothetical protein